MTNKTIKTCSLILGVLLSSSYLVAASPSETLQNKNTSARRPIKDIFKEIESASSIGPEIKAYLASGDQNAPLQPKYNAAQLVEIFEQKRAQERENLEKQAASGDQDEKEQMSSAAGPINLEEVD